MTLARTVAWDVQTGGNSANGGGFNTASAGTDRSQSTSAFVAFNGTSITAATAGITNIITLTGYTAVAGDVGNILNITGGTNFTAGRYEITAQGGTTWTLDRNCTTAAGAAMTGNMGGCLDTVQHGMDAMAGTGSITDQITWVKFGTYNISTALNTTATSSATAYQNRVVGYNTTHGDSPTGANRPTIATNNNSINGLNISNINGWRFENFIFDGSGTTKGLVGVYVTQQYNIIFNCKILNFASQGILSTARLFAYSCEITGCAATTGNGAVDANSAGIYYCYIHDNPRTGIAAANSGASDVLIIKSIVSNNTGANSDGINTDYSAVLLGNVIFGNGRDGLRLQSSYDQLYSVVTNNIFVSNGGYAINWLAAPVFQYIPTYDYNAFYNNTSGSYHNQTAGTHDVALTGDPFTASGSNDFTLNNTAGAGASCRNAGLPGPMPGLTQVGYDDIGALRHQDAGGSSGMLFIPNLEAT